MPIKLFKAHCSAWPSGLLLVCRQSLLQRALPNETGGQDRGR